MVTWNEVKDVLKYHDVKFVVLKEEDEQLNVKLNEELLTVYIDGQTVFHSSTHDVWFDTFQDFITDIVKGEIDLENERY